MASHLFRGLKMQRRSLKLIPRITSALVNSTQEEKTSVDFHCANKSAGELHEITTPPVPVRLVQRFMFSSSVKKKVKVRPFVCLECLNKGETSDFCSPYTLFDHQKRAHPKLCELNIRCHKCFHFFKSEEARDNHICVMNEFENYMECVLAHQRTLDKENEAQEKKEREAREEAEKEAEKAKAKKEAEEKFDKEYKEEEEKEAEKEAEKAKAKKEAEEKFDKEYKEEEEKEAEKEAEKAKAKKEAEEKFEKEYKEEEEKEAREKAEREKVDEEKD